MQKEIDCFSSRCVDDWFSRSLLTRCWWRLLWRWWRWWVVMVSDDSIRADHPWKVSTIRWWWSVACAVHMYSTMADNRIPSIFQAHCLQNICITIIHSLQAMSMYRTRSILFILFLTGADPLQVSSEKMLSAPECRERTLSDWHMWNNENMTKPHHTDHESCTAQHPDQQCMM